MTMINNYTSARISGMSQRLDLYRPICSSVRLAVAVVSCGCSSGFGCRSRCRVRVSSPAPAGASRFRASVGWRLASRLCSSGRFSRALLVGFRCGRPSGFGCAFGSVGWGSGSACFVALVSGFVCPSGGVRLRLARCRSRCPLLRLRRPLGFRFAKSSGNCRSLRSLPKCGVLYNRSAITSPYRGTKRAFWTIASGSSADIWSVTPRLRHPRRGFFNADSPSGWLPQDRRVPVPPRRRRAVKAGTSPALRRVQMFVFFHTNVRIFPQDVRLRLLILLETTQGFYIQRNLELFWINY